jgi:hypothetical protein
MQAMRNFKTDVMKMGASVLGVGQSGAHGSNKTTQDFAWEKGILP